jgi:hypothetical protein
MTAPTPPDLPGAAADDRFARLLEDCLRAELALPGSSAAIVRSAPAELQLDLEHVLAAAQALREVSPHLATESRIPGKEARDMRARIMRRITQPGSMTR